MASDGTSNVWMSVYGPIPIPDDVYRQTPWKTNKKGVITGVLPVIESRHFWNWLHGEEVKAGKVE